MLICLNEWKNDRAFEKRLSDGLDDGNLANIRSMD